MTTWREVLERVGVGALVLGAFVVALAVAYLVPSQPMLGLSLAAVVFIAVLALVNPVTLPLLAMPAIVISSRIEGGGLDLSVGTLALGLAVWPALVFAPRPLSAPLRQLLWLNAVYQAATLFTVLANPFLANTVDWFHNWLIVSGSLVVGWAVGRSGVGRLGIRLFLVAVGFVALTGTLEGLFNYTQGNFEPLYPSVPFPMHKNFFGTLACFGALMFFARPAWVGLPRLAAHAGFWVCVLAMGVSQSRQALIAIAVGLLVISIKGRSERRRAWLGAVFALPALALVATLVRDQIASGNQHNSYFQRLEWYGDSIAVWQSSPVFGVGLRYWTTGINPEWFQPPQVFLEVLATAGVVGLAGLLVMMAGMLKVLWSLPGLTGSIALALVVSRFVQGQLDIFWLSPTTAIPFVLAGVCLGVVARDAELKPSDSRTLAGVR